MQNIPDEFFISAKNILKILLQAKDDKKHNTPNDLSHEMEFAVVTDPKTGKKFQVVLKVIVKEKEFLERGKIYSRTEPDRDKIPFKIVTPRDQ